MLQNLAVITEVSVACNAPGTLILPGMVLAKYMFEGKFMLGVQGAVQALVGSRGRAPCGGQGVLPPEADEFETNEALCGLSRHATVNVLLSN